MVTTRIWYRLCNLGSAVTQCPRAGPGHQTGLVLSGGLNVRLVSENLHSALPAHPEAHSTSFLEGMGIEEGLFGIFML